MTNIDSGTPEALANFLNWGSSKYPATNIALVLWGHGFGLDDYVYHPPAILPSKSSASRSHIKSALPAFDFAASLFGDATSNVLPVSRFAEQGLAIFGDITRGSSLSNSDLGNVLRAWTKTLQGQTLAIVGFDCCQMAMIEVWGEISDSVEIALGSQYGIPYTSFPYNLCLRELIDNPLLTPQGLSDAVINTFVDYYDEEVSQPSLTLSACDMSKTQNLYDAVKELATSLTLLCADATARSAIFDVRNASPVYDLDGAIDLGDFCRRLEIEFPGSIISAECEVVRQRLGEYVLRSAYTPTDSTEMISRSTGISVWFPAWIKYRYMEMPERRESEAYLQVGYEATTFAVETGWDIFLKTLLKLERY
jgi:hypothetical protein